MTDIMARLNNYNWDAYYQNEVKQNVFSLADKGLYGDQDPHILPSGINEGDDQNMNTEYTMGLMLAQDTDDHNKSLKYTMNDEIFKEIVDDLNEKEEEKHEDEEEGDDLIYMLARNAIGNAYLDSLQFSAIDIVNDDNSFIHRDGNSMSGLR